MKEMVFYIHNGDNYEEYAADIDKVERFRRQIGHENILREEFLTKCEDNQRLKITYKDVEAKG